MHVQDVLYATSLPALLLARRRGIASVLTQHVAFVPQGTRLLNGLQRLAFASLGRGFRMATIVATYNTSVAEWVARRWRIGEVPVLPVGVETTAGETADRAQLRRSFDLPEDRFLALFVGRDVPKKGLDLFLGARGREYELVAVTDRPPAQDGSTVAFMSPARLQGLMHCVDAFVLPSEGEGFPLSLQEALANGLPVVTTRHPGYEQYLGPDDVLFVERDARSIRDALKRLAADGELRTRLSERARAVAERHFRCREVRGGVRGTLRSSHGAGGGSAASLDTDGDVSGPTRRAQAPRLLLPIRRRCSSRTSRPGCRLSGGPATITRWLADDPRVRVCGRSRTCSS